MMLNDDERRSQFSRDYLGMDYSKLYPGPDHEK